MLELKNIFGFTEVKELFKGDSNLIILDSKESIEKALVLHKDLLEYVGSDKETAYKKLFGRIFLLNYTKKSLENKSIKVKESPKYNYLVLFDKTSECILKFGKPGEENKELPSEIYEVAINNKCHGGYPWYYSEINSKGENYKDILETWDTWIQSLPESSKPFSIIIGSIGEPTEHPDFPKFLEAVYKSEVSPCYITNGVIIGTPRDPRAEIILDATKKYCRRVAISLVNKRLSNYQQRAIQALNNIGVKISLYYLISDKNSVKFFVDTWKTDKEYKFIHVLLPSVDINQGVTINSETLELLQSEILKYEMKNVVFSSKFIKNDKSSLFHIEELHPENIILKDKKVVITENSFDLRPIKIINIK